MGCVLTAGRCPWAKISSSIYSGSHSPYTSHPHHEIYRSEKGSSYCIQYKYESHELIQGCLSLFYVQIFASFSFWHTFQTRCRTSSFSLAMLIASISSGYHCLYHGSLTVSILGLMPITYPPPRSRTYTGFGPCGAFPSGVNEIILWYLKSLLLEILRWSRAVKLQW